MASNDKSLNSPSLAGGDSTYSPSLAEGVRGWVNPLLHKFPTFCTKTVHITLTPPKT
ncbi:hypothetical protein [Helicobacter macacae]|uniref:hypothetical protein n=1 Tax=Helicobacter macacae TaxID=398626 RepID=UPI0003FFC549|nr:hypothetical protein [Helicobacter macacae]